jgi:hypothetical protein
MGGSKWHMKVQLSGKIYSLCAIFFARAWVSNGLLDSIIAGNALDYCTVEWRHNGKWTLYFVKNWHILLVVSAVFRSMQINKYDIKATSSSVSTVISYGLNYRNRPLVDARMFFFLVASSSVLQLVYPPIQRDTDIRRLESEAILLHSSSSECKHASIHISEVRN